MQLSNKFHENTNAYGKLNKEYLSSLRQSVIDHISNPLLTHERLEIMTKVYEESNGEHPLLLRAKAFDALLREMTIYIKDYEFIVGNLAPEPFSAPIYPEQSQRWILDELDDFENRPGDRFRVPETTKRKIRELLPKWSGRSVQDRAISLMSPRLLHSRECKLIAFENTLTSGIGHFVPGYEDVLTEGWSGLAQRIEEKLSNLDTANPGDFEKSIFYRAAHICCRAACRFAERYSELAESLSKKSSDPSEKRRLAKIREVCLSVSSGPPRTFHEALQALWFTHLLCFINQNGLAVTLGRMDQYLYPFFDRERIEGSINSEDAKFLLGHFMIKCNEIVKLYNNLASTYYGGFPITQALQLGGFLPNGNDATNELSNIILDAEMLVALPQPDLAVLWTNRMDSNYLEKAVQVIPKSMKPKFFNAHVGMQHLLSLGADLTEARNYAFAGCVESTIAGKTWHWANAGSVNLVKCLELTFTRGVDHSTGERLGKDTGALSKFSNFEDFYAAFSEQVKNATKLLVNALHCVETAHRDLVPLPYESLLVRDCIDKGRDLHQGGAKFNLTGIQGVGLATTADSLFAIKRSVFEEKKFTLKQLLEMVQRDWEGKEAERQYVLHKIDKYGNDEDEVDSIAGKIVDTYCKGVAEFKNLRGGPFVPGLFSVSTHVPFGFNVLSFDGRKKNDPLSDGCSPSQGRASKGPTAVAASLAKLDHAAVINGTLLNAKFNSMALSEHETIKKLSKFVGAFMRMDGFHLQINLINPAMLREAIDHPERHPNLLVRVAAYVALFSQLSREIQEEILSRSELGL